MARIKRFESHRFVGSRDDMVVYDTDIAAQSESLRIRSESDDLLGRNLLQSFAPDDLAEARNRGFKPAR
ncbi:MAG: hypothetical protein GY720_11430 [bacterium]|nr:hypothetical protein [bacterium]